MSVFAPLMLAAPLLLLAMAVVELASYGPLGWLAAVGLLLAVATGTRLAVRAVLRWWRGTKVPPRPQVRPADRRRACPPQVPERPA